MVRFIEDLLAGIFSFVPKEKRYYRQKRMQEWCDFFYELRDQYSVLEMIPFRNKGAAGIDSRQLNQAHSNMSGYHISSWGLNFDPFEINVENCKRTFERERAKFTDDEVKQMKEIAEKYIERFGITEKESGFGSRR
ncbi:hypothetical protein KY346_00810 [Candidatus Woesearchaeota archaeon]|nr:hypothetical protein [Candidatus Woesearchaeota archaeon]